MKKKCPTCGHLLSVHRHYQKEVGKLKANSFRCTAELDNGDDCDCDRVLWYSMTTPIKKSKEED